MKNSEIVNLVLESTQFTNRVYDEASAQVRLVKRELIEIWMAFGKDEQVAEAMIRIYGNEEATKIAKLIMRRAEASPYE